MLQILRNKSQSVFIQIIVVIIALVFVFMGAGSMMNNTDAAIVVNDEEISFQQYQRAYEQAHQNLANQFGGNVPKGIAEALGLKEQVINQLVQAELLRQGAEQMGVRLSDLEIRQTIQAMSQFQKDGQFDKEAYNAVLNSNRLSPTKFEASMRYDMIAEKTARLIGNFSNSATDFEIRDIYNQINDSVSVNYVKFSPESYVDTITVNEEELTKWFETAKEEYQTAPQIKLSYLAYNYDTVGAKIEIDEASISNFYNNNTLLYTTPEKRHARHILLKASSDDSPATHTEKKALAEKVKQLAITGSDFATLAEQYSEGPSKTNGGDLGFFERGSMVPSFDEAVFQLNPGSISDIVKTDFGYHIIKLEEVQPENVLSLEEAKEKIIVALQREQAQSLVSQLANSAYEGIIGAGSLKAYVENNQDAPLITTDFFSRENAPEELKQNQAFLNAAFKLNKSELSSLIQTSNGYAIIFADDTKDSEPQTLDAVREEAITDFKAFLSDEEAKKKAEEFLQALNKDGDLDFKAIAEAQGAVSKTTDYLKRQNNSDSNFPASLVEQIFLLSPDKPLPEEVATAESSYYVFSYLGRKSPESFDETEKEQYHSGILLNKRQMVLSAWLAHQQSNSVVSTHPSL